MKLVIDEKLKHRLIGVAVIISLGAIFAPAMMKKSGQNMETNYSVHIKLPPKPAEPNVALSDEKEVFKTIKIARVKLPEVSAESQLPELAKADSIQSEQVANNELSNLALQKESVKEEHLALNKVAQETVKHVVNIASARAKTPLTGKAAVIAAKTTKPTKKAAVVALNRAQVTPQIKRAKIAQASKRTAVRTEHYAVQLASFSQLSNAQSLVNKLRSRGYKANFKKVSSRTGVSYKVFAGHSPKKMEVIKLKTQLASAMQLNGFIVTTGVS